MEEENGPGPSNRPYRIRRSSSSLISSTTFPTPPPSNAPPPGHHGQPSPSPGGSAHTPRGRSFHNNANNQDDEPSSSSNLANFPPPSPRHRSTYSRNLNNNPSSPLGSPDSTYHWGASPSPISYRGGNGPGGPATPGGLCQVSSSTVDDSSYPPSPFNEPEGNNHMLPPISSNVSRASTSSSSISFNNTSNNMGIGSNNGQNLSNLSPPSQAAFSENLPPPPTSSASSSSSSSSGGASLNSNILGIHTSPSPSFASSPLVRNKIKKASSFERFSQAQAASASNTANRSSNNSSNSVLLSTLNGGGGIPGESCSSESASRILNWDSVLPSSSSSTTAPSTCSPTSTPIMSSNPNPMISIQQSYSDTIRSSSSNHSQIKIPSKKLAAKIAFEQAQLNELNEQLAAAAAAAASELNSIVVNPLGDESSSTSTSSTHHIVVGGGAHESLLQELSGESPLNLTESSSTSSSNTSSIIRGPIISSNSSNSGKKIPLTPKQKLLHLHQQQTQQQIISTLQQQALQQQQQQDSLPLIQEPSQHLQSTSSSSSASQQPLDNTDSVIQETCSQQQQHSPSSHLDSYSYNDLLRARDDLIQDNGGNKEDGGPGGVLYDTSNDYYYNYGILPDEIFTGSSGTGSNSGGRLLLMPSDENSLGQGGPNGAGSGGGHHPGPLEFVLAGLNEERLHRGDEMGGGGCVDDDEDEDDEGMGGGGGGGGGPTSHFLSSDLLKSNNESTLRNLLMMEPLRSHDEPPWAPEPYQNRCNLRPTTSSLMNINSLSNHGWINDWPRSSWQMNTDEQEEVMDMSGPDKLSSNSNNNMLGGGGGPSSSSSGGKRMMHSNNHQDSHLDDVDSIVVDREGLLLSSGLPIDLQQPLNLLNASSSSNNLAGKNGNELMISQNDPIALDLHHHHHRLMSSSSSSHHSLLQQHHDEPVNLISANIEPEMSSHQSSSSSSNNLLHSHTHSQMMESIPKNNSYNISMNSSHSSQQQQQEEVESQQEHVFHVENTDNIDERRIIRKKRTKETETVESLASQKQSAGPNFIPDRPVQRKSFASLPAPLSLIKLSGAGWAVFTSKESTIQRNTRFGPVEGPLKKAYAEDLENPNATYPCLLMVDSSNILWHLDDEDDELCNWMKFCRLAKNQKELNTLIIEEDGLLYFTTIKEIPPKTEISLGYCFDYASKYGLPYIQLPPSPSPIDHLQLNENSESNLESFLCFECEIDFASIEQLNKHLEQSHKQIEEGKKVKKKEVKRANNLVSSSSSTTIVSKKHKYLIDGSLARLGISLKDRVKGELYNRVEDDDDEDEEDEEEEEEEEVVKEVPVKSKCTICYKSFATKQRLEKHMIVHSSEETKPLKCSFCTKRFLTNSALAGHQKIHNEEGKNFECPMCPWATHQLLQLKEHVQGHKNPETGSFHCTHCPKKFHNYPMIRKHIRAFHGPRDWACDTPSCSMTFPTPDKLKLHKLRHSDHREYLCHLCGRQFKRKDKLREHTKRMHEAIKKKPNLELNLRGDKERRPSKKFNSKVTIEQFDRFLYKCDECVLGFKRRGMLVNHLAKRHPDKSPSIIPELNLPIQRPTKNFYCPYCERVYKSSSKRKAHIIKSHPGKAIPPQVRSTSILTLSGKKNGSIEENIASSSDDLNNERREAIVGKIATVPHHCQWCYRQYATRAKLLQHQRKNHIHLMPPEIQLPRAQKNNVIKIMEQSELISVAVSSDGKSMLSIPASSISSIPVSSHNSDESNNIIGFLLTSATLSENGSLSNILPAGEIVIMNSSGGSVQNQISVVNAIDEN